MSKRKHDDESFNPDFSEYNPVVEEVAEIKERLSKEENKNFFRKLIDRFTFRIIIQMD